MPIRAGTPAATRGETDLRLMRAIVGFLGGWSACRKACRRAHACASPTVACFDENLDAIRAELAALAEWPRLDGPRDSAELGQPVKNLFD